MEKFAELTTFSCYPPHILSNKGFKGTVVNRTLQILHAFNNKKILLKKSCYIFDTTFPALTREGEDQSK